MAALTPAHDAVLARMDWLPDDVEADAEVVADLLGIPEAEAARLLDELEAAGDVASTRGPVQHRMRLQRNERDDPGLDTRPWWPAWCSR